MSMQIHNVKKLLICNSTLKELHYSMLVVVLSDNMVFRML